MAEITYDKVQKIYPDGTQAVHDLDLEIADGELMVLVGPSGCGKTTALRMLAGLEEISDGEIRIGDRVVNDLTPKDRDVAMVFQSYALYPHMTVHDNLAFGLKLRKTPKHEVEERVRRAAKVLQIEEFLKRKPRALSGGQRQRVAMGRAIVREPEAFLMDEPLSNLDAKLRVEMRTYLATLHRRLRTTTLYVTHDQTEAMTMGDRVAVMDRGRLQQVDTPKRLYDGPVNLFVAGFIGSPAMNLLHARLDAVNGGLIAHCGPMELPLPGSLLEQRPGLCEHVGRPIVLGIRPEDIEDASLVPSANGSSLDVDVTLAEELGAEVVAHFPLAVRPVGAPEGETGAVLTARLSPRCRAETGGHLRVVVDVERLHFFDPETEAAVW